MDDKTMPNKSVNTSKTEGERWSSNADTVEKKDREQQGSQDRTQAEGTATNAGGITNRPLAEEDANQAAVPERGESQRGAHAGHGDRERSER